MRPGRHADLLAAGSPSQRVPAHVQVWAAVLRKAVVDCVLYTNCSNPRLKKIGKEAERWLFSGDAELFNSVDNVCLYLNIDVSQIRASVLNIDSAAVRRLRGMGFDE